MPRGPRIALCYLTAALFALGRAALPLDQPVARASTSSRSSSPVTRATTPRATHAVTPSYDVRVEPPPPMAVGQPATATVQIRAKGQHKITHDYPTRLRVRSGAVQLELGRADATITARKLTFDATLVFRKPGRYPVKGTVRFSLCDKHRCRLHTEPLRWTVSIQHPTP